MLRAAVSAADRDESGPVGERSRLRVPHDRSISSETEEIESRASRGTLVLATGWFDAHALLPCVTVSHRARDFLDNEGKGKSWR